MLLNTNLLLLILLMRLYFNHQVKCEENTSNFDMSTCNNILSSELISEIDSYFPTVNQIINAAINGSFTNQTWLELADFIDEFGPRFTGTQNLENSIDYMLEKSKGFGLENVHGEPVTVSRWIRGQESAKLLSPREKNIKILGLGFSIGTPPEGITAEAIVVDSFEELEKRADEVDGKIVVFNQEFENYDETVTYRYKGAQQAATFGAVATLIRSITPFSIYSPHTGEMEYNETIKKIPAASITIEDAELLNRMEARGKNITIKLLMEAHQLPDGESRNVIAEIIGSSKPEKVVVASGHIDSWDVGQGAMDDGAGVFTSWGSLVLLKSLNLRPKRTIRAIMWTAEEMGRSGAKHYIRQHKDEQKDLQLVMESDRGTFLPFGWEVIGSAEVVCILGRITKLMSSMTPLGVTKTFHGPDIERWVGAGVPGATLWNQNDRYFWFHHTDGDTMDVEDPENLDIITAIFAATAYVVADISLDFPRHNLTLPQ